MKVPGNISVEALERKIKILEAELRASGQSLAELSLSLERFTTHYQIIPIPTFSWQKKGAEYVLIRHNDAAKSVLPGWRADILGSTASELFGHFPGILQAFEHCYASRDVDRVEVDLSSGRNRRRHYLVHLVLLPPDIVLMYFEDITERKAAQLALQRAHDRLEAEVARRTADLVKTNKALERDIAKRKRTESALREKEQKLREQARHLSEMNTALKVLLDYREEERKKLERRMLVNVKKLVFPYLDKLERCAIDREQKTYLHIVRTNLKDFISPFAQTLSAHQLNFTPAEIQVADLIRRGTPSKDIADLLQISTNAVAFHRANIRRKLGLCHSKVNLRAHLQSLEP